MSLAPDSVLAAGPTQSPLPQGFRLSFTQGFLAGQLSVVLIALVAIRYVIFEDSRAAAQKSRSGRSKSRSQGELTRKGRKGVSSKDGRNAADASIATLMADIMGKVRYEVDSHGGESVDWLNVFIAQALAGYREDIMAGGWSAEKKSSEAQRTAREWMEDVLNAKTVGMGMTFLVSAGGRSAKMQQDFLNKMPLRIPSKSPMSHLEKPTPSLPMPKSARPTTQDAW